MCVCHSQADDNIYIGNEHLTATIDSHGRVVELYATGSHKYVFDYLLIVSIF